MKTVTQKRISIVNAILLALVSLLSIAAMTVSPAHASSLLMPSDQCDAEAGSARDTKRNMAFPPVETENIRIGIALSACREAYNQGGGPRQAFQLARVLQAAGQRARAITLLKDAMKQSGADAVRTYIVLLDENSAPLSEEARALPARISTAR